MNDCPIELLDSQFAGRNISVPFKKFNEIVKSPKNMKPIVILAGSGCGKTTFAVDVINKLSPQLNYCYFVSQTSSSITGSNLSKIPNFFIRNIKNNDDPFEVINNIWEDIKSRVEAMNLEESKINDILGILFPGKFIMKYINEYIKNLKKSDNDAGVLKVEIITRIILDKILEDESLLTKLNPEQRKLVCGLITPSISSLLILDDMTSVLNSLKSAKDAISFNNSSMKKNEAYKNLLVDIFTRARHYNCLVMIFLHTLEAIDVGSVFNNIDNIIVMDATSFSKISTTRRFKNDNLDSKLLEFIAQRTKIFQYKYYSLFINISSSQFYILKADIYKDTHEISLSSTRSKFNNSLNKIINRELNPSLAPLSNNFNKNNLLEDSENSNDSDILDMEIDNFDF